MKNLGAYVVGFVAGIGTMWGFAYWKMKASVVTVPAGTLVYSGTTGQTAALAAATPSSSLPLGSAFLMGGHEYSVQANGTVQVT